MQSRSDSTHARVPELDGLRGIAIALVLFLHVSVIPCENFLWRPIFGDAITRVLRGFSSGVDIFFVLSGFLIGGLVLDGRDAPVFFRSFYARRTARVFPLYFALIALAFAPLGAFSLHAAEGSIPALAYATFTENFFSSFGVRYVDALGPLWSICIEEQFYLLAPLALRRLSWPAIPRCTLAVAVLSLGLRSFFTLGASAPPFDPWDFTLTRMDGLALGVLAAWLVREPASLRWLQARGSLLAWSSAAALLGFLFSTQRVVWHVSAGVTLVACATMGAILLVCTRAPQGLSRALRSAALSWLGRHSYCLYLFHLPFIAFGRALFVHDVWVSGYALMFVDAFSLLALLCFAAASWQYVESPIIARARRLSGAGVERLAQ